MMRHAIFVTVLVAVGFGCIRLGERSARALEQLLIDRVENGLEVLEIDWAEVRADGLRLELHGHAPNIFARDMALESARATAPIAVVTDYTSVSLAPPPHRDPVRVEMLRDEQGLTLTGRFHGEAMRANLIAALAVSAPGLNVHDLTGINAAPPDASLDAELAIAALAAARVRNAYVVIDPGAVQVGGLVRDADHRHAVSKALTALAGDTVRLSLNLREPLVVVAPFVFAVVKDGSGGMRLEACVARSVEEAATLEAVLDRLGIALGEVKCPAALGGPTGNWAGMVTAGLEALDLLPAGRFRLTYHTAELNGLPPTESAEMAAAQSALAAALPEGYALQGGLAAGDEGCCPTADETRYWMRFSRVPGQVVLRGAVPNAISRRLIETYAAARFGQAALGPALTLADSDAGARLPADWESAALAALDGLSGISTGNAELEPGRIAIWGTVAGPAEAGRLHRLIVDRAPAGYVVATALTIDVPAQVAAVPLSALRCAVVLGAAVEGLPIAFAPGSAVIEAGSGEALDRLSDILRRCDRGRIEIGGHTDSQGSTGLNLRLSRARAEAVLDALLAREVPLGRLAARGYGEDQPVASNETEAGRARNRRIEFTMLDAGVELKTGE